MDTRAKEIEALVRRLEAAERRGRVTVGVALAAAVGAFTLGANPAARAQLVKTPLEILINRVEALENKTQDMSRDVDPNTGQPTVRFTGVNVQIVDGSEDAGGPVNGRGNLIVGYNAWRPGAPGFVNVRTGSHNLIVGSFNNYSSFGGLVAGAFNNISAPYASVSGGEGNVASGESSSVSGGGGNTASGYAASVSGGILNKASGSYAAMSGGYGRSAAGEYDWVAGTLFQNF